MSLLSLFLDLLSVIGLTKSDKDLEIIILRQHVRILQRKITTPPRISDPERMILATLTDKHRHSADRAHQRRHEVMLILTPDTVIRWHRNLIRRSGPSNVKEIHPGPAYRLNLKP